jgi:subtilisin family serine protease
MNDSIIDNPLNINSTIEWTAPVYRIDDISGREGLICPLPNILIVKLANENEPTKQRLSELNLIEVPEKSKYLNGFKYFRIRNPLDKNSYEIKVILEEENLILDSYFENISMLEPTLLVPNDPLFPNQWNLKKIFAGGNSPTGWDITIGHEDISIAIIDHPCNLTNEELNGNTSMVNLSTMENSTNFNDNKIHGTQCLGIISAKINNNIGIAGLAPKCKTVSLGTISFSDTEIVQGIYYAADNNIRIISMSFGFYKAREGDGLGPILFDTTQIDEAIEYAFNKGCILFAASGNDDVPIITYPARHKSVICCGASDQEDNRKSINSPDGQVDWGSNFGTNISVVAPGVFIPTISHAGNPLLVFRGTSSSCPQVAALAGLILSIRPSLTNIEVRKIIESTADKVGVNPYVEIPGFQNGTRNEQMGYGRINVFKALNALNSI